MLTVAGCASSSRRSSTDKPKIIRRNSPPRRSSVGVLYNHNEWLESVREAGGEPVGIPRLPSTVAYGRALLREWVADQVEIACAMRNLSALLVVGGLGGGPHGLPGVLLAAMRMDLPVVLAHRSSTDPFHIALVAAGFSALSTRNDSAQVAVEMAREAGPRPRELLNGFSLANALRAGLAAGGGAQFLVHLAAVAREAGEVGFSRMVRVLAPESPAFVVLPASRHFPTHLHLLASLRDVLHDVGTVEKVRLREVLPNSPERKPVEKDRLHFVSGRASGVEAVAQAAPGVEEVAGECRVFGSEDEAIDGVAEGRVKEGHLVVVAGCGVRGGPGLLGLDFLRRAMVRAGVDVPVITDGLPPGKSSGLGKSPWISLFTPEAAAGGVIGRLRDGDTLRFDLKEGLIRTSVRAEEILARQSLAIPAYSGFGYAARYARTALPALEGAGFG